MTDHSLLAWVLLSIGLVLIPGPDTMIVAGHAARRGFKAGLAAVSGIMAGGLFYMALCGFGFLSILTIFPTLFTIVKVAGGLYLAWLGFRLLKGAIKPAQADTSEPSAEPASGTPFRQGILTTVLNPKVGLFFVSILPQFVGNGPDAPLRGMLFIAVPYFIGFFWLSGIAFFASRAARGVRQSSLIRWFEGLVGTAFIGLAGRMVLVRNS